MKKVIKNSMLNDKVKFCLNFLEENKNDKECLKVNIKNLEEHIKKCKNNNLVILELPFCEWHIDELKYLLKNYRKALKELKTKELENR